MEVDVLQMTRIGKPPTQRHLGVFVPSGEVDISELQALFRRGDFVLEPKGGRKRPRSRTSQGKRVKTRGDGATENE